MKYIHKIILSISLPLLFFSCKKVINIQETDSINESNAMTTVENVEQAVIGMYSGMQVEMGYLLNSTFSDEVKTAGEFYNSISTHEWQYGSEDVTIRDNFTAMGPYYQAIDRANRILAGVDVADSTRLGDNTLRPRLKAEALYFRAFSHFEMFRYYCANYDPNGLGMPYMEIPSSELSSLGPQKRIKMVDYFNKINADLSTAKGLLPNNLTDRTRANKLAASALQARIALYIRDWANAVTYSSEYITAIPLSPRAEFNGIWTDANNNEVAFKLKRSTTNNPYGRIGSIYRNTSSSATNIGTVVWAPASKLWDTYDQTNDIRFSSYVKDEPLLTARGRQSRIIQKYAGTGYGTAAENIADAKVFRTGEMYLIRAEAKAETNDLAGAAADINALRAARITGYTNVTFASKQEAIDAIMLERFKELPFEGHRFWDLKRRGLPVVRIGTDIPSPSGATLSANNFRFLLPIPKPEMQANNLMEQNPGY
jgi:hypothetical protein